MFFFSGVICQTNKWNHYLKFVKKADICRGLAQYVKSRKNNLKQKQKFQSNPKPSEQFWKFVARKYKILH